MSLRLRHIILILSVALILALALGGCRTSSRAVKSSSGSWTTLSIPLKARLLEPSRKSFSGRAYFRRGESVYVSIRVLGFEAASLYIDRDSIRAFEKLNSSYIALPSSLILDRRGMSMERLQDMMLGAAGADKPLSFELRPGLALRIDYSDPVPVSIVGSMASEVSLSSRYKDRPVSASLEWRTDDARFDVDIPSWKAPSRPRQVDPASLLRLLQSL